MGARLVAEAVLPAGRVRLVRVGRRHAVGRLDHVGDARAGVRPGGTVIVRECPS
ncbi:hypothetical protein [Streptomyces sp. ICC4]|uniref:hypothetical protein n=1 Tax=Streptomyces sp. ICC4 TaxID=2099584 RepID=UPI0013A6DAE0|nr:hypothetical protein [Streptomyces sp. ICC4]